MVRLCGLFSRLASLHIAANQHMLVPAGDFDSLPATLTTLALNFGVQLSNENFEPTHTKLRLPRLPPNLTDQSYACDLPTLHLDLSMLPRSLRSFDFPSSPDVRIGSFDSHPGYSIMEGSTKGLPLLENFFCEDLFLALASAMHLVFLRYLGSSSLSP